MNRWAWRGIWAACLMLGLMIGRAIMDNREYDRELTLEPLYPAAPSPPPPESQGFTYEVVTVAPGVRCAVFTHMWNGRVRHDAAVGVDCWEDR